MKLTKFFTLIFVTMMVSMPVNILLDAENVQARPVENTVQTAEIFIYGWVNESGTVTPIQSVTVYFGDMHGYDASNSSGTDVSGYYELNLNVTNFHEFLMHGIHDAYLLNQTTFWINEFGGSVKINIELDTAPPRSSRLNGYLLDAITGLPMAGENLTAASDDYINNTQTDVSGYYSMGFIPGDYTMGAGSTGYESTTLQFTLDDSYTLWRNITLEPLNCTLKGFIKGSGGPLDNAYAYVEEPWNVDPWDDDYWNYTDATGYYEMNLTRGTKNVGFRNDGYLSTSRPITVQAGINWLNVTLVDTPPETCTVMGFIREFNTGNPINNSNIRVGNMNNSWGTGNNSDPTGYYELDVIEGNLRIEADKWDGEGQYHRNGTELTAVAGMPIWQNITLVNNSAPQATIRGNITLDGT
ncbi:MAG: carboxypeptidase regulatory-like domain-containing protein, partial [Thermoplasmata archaeon]|nr:carboxypeptidase regulatory-like domain-containing protein [Thermoplasmata archaeon]